MIGYEAGNCRGTNELKAGRLDGGCSVRARHPLRPALACSPGLTRASRVCLTQPAAPQPGHQPHPTRAAPESTPTEAWLPPQEASSRTSPPPATDLAFLGSKPGSPTAVSFPVNNLNSQGLFLSLLQSGTNNVTRGGGGPASAGPRGGWGGRGGLCCGRGRQDTWGLHQVPA